MGGAYGWPNYERLLMLSDGNTITVALWGVQVIRNAETPRSTLLLVAIGQK